MSDVKYHISKKTQLPNRCNAQIQCPLGADTPHFDTSVEAKQWLAAEAAKEGVTLTALRKKRVLAEEAKENGNDSQNPPKSAPEASTQKPSVSSTYKQAAQQPKYVEEYEVTFKQGHHAYQIGRLLKNSGSPYSISPNNDGTVTLSGKADAKLQRILDGVQKGSIKVDNLELYNDEQDCLKRKDIISKAEDKGYTYTSFNLPKGPKGDEQAKYLRKVIKESSPELFHEGEQVKDGGLGPIAVTARKRTFTIASPTDETLIERTTFIARNKRYEKEQSFSKQDYDKVSAAYETAFGKKPRKPLFSGEFKAKLDGDYISHEKFWLAMGKKPKEILAMYR